MHFRKILCSAGGEGLAVEAMFDIIERTRGLVDVREWGKMLASIRYEDVKESSSAYVEKYQAVYTVR